jgi:hypothetical protein
VSQSVARRAKKKKKKSVWNENARGSDGFPRAESGLGRADRKDGGASSPRARLFRARASRTIVASAYLSCSPMRFQSASSWSFSYEVCRRPRANAPRVPRRRSDFPPASCGASARTSARREAHRRVASPPAPMAIPERSPRSPRGSVSVSPPPRGCLWHGHPRHRGQRYSRAVVTISYRLAHSTVSDSRFGADAKVEFARELEFSRQQRRSSGRANQRSRRGAGRATGSRRGAFPRRG